jgi:transcriptional regulator with XRE-family HTH domain
MLSETLLKARTSLSLNQSEVAEYVGVAQSAYFNWESAKHTPSTKYLPKLCQILNLSINDVLPPPITT